ncbi:bifunctional diguanylate cyclase/phosphodiesterase [Luteibacter sp. PPL201]|uniref:Bifunctional diguanylate cyclase/phosphodiesterase n=1 Tax=Luteibacter sahnii TaxID=3021977 RepID=A0ABT6B8T4_9GAMM
MTGPRGILVFTPRKDTRRAVFDALDAEGDFALLSARDASQLAALLVDAPPLHVAVVAADGTDDIAQGLRILRARPEYATLPVVYLVADAPGSTAPADHADWLRENAVGDELVHRLRAAMAGHAPDETPPVSFAGDYRFAFDTGGAWVVANTPEGCVLESGEAMNRLCMGDGPVAGRLLRELFVLSGESTWPLPDGDGHPCVLRRGDGRDVPGEVDVRHLVDARGHRVAVGFRDLRVGQVADRALGLLAELDAFPADDEGMGATAGKVADALGLDVLALWSAFPETDGEPALVARVGERTEWPDAADIPLLQLCLHGEALSRLVEGPGVAMADPLVESLGLEAFAFLPLMDERRNVVGAMLAGSRRHVGAGRMLEVALRAVGARFAAALELRRSREQGRARGLIDPLTGLPNRLLFDDRLDTTIREAARTGERFAVLMIDLDRFKGINDTLGHAAGDQVLSAVARRLRASVRGSDTVARYAGDEFTMILRHIVKRDDVQRIAEKVVQAMELPLGLGDGSELQSTVSIGVAFFPDDALESEALLHHADEAMYGAKSLGRNNYQVYASNVDTSQQQQNELKSRLRHAVRNGELRVFYQPQVNTVSEDIVGMEALVRWEHPGLGMISPAFFIPLAETTGLIVAIGEWVLRHACEQARLWQDRYGLGLRLGVNLSAVQLMQPGLVGEVATILRETGLDPSLLELEVTESISVKTVPHLEDTLQALHALGCGIAIDDFGTGAASLDYLRRLPAGRIKIDQSFVRNIGVDPDDEAIVRSTIEMAHRLKREVVAEGVEVEEHLQFLRAQGCDELQGYLFCRPLPTPTFEKLLAERQRIVGDRLPAVTA